MKAINIPDESKLDELAVILFDAAQKYWDEYQKQIGGNAVIWVQDNNTGQFVCYTRGEYTKDLINIINEF